MLLTADTTRINTHVPTMQFIINKFSNLMTRVIETVINVYNEMLENQFLVLQPNFNY